MKSKKILGILLALVMILGMMIPGQGGICGQ
jgi:hypothetical protein